MTGGHPFTEILRTFLIREDLEVQKLCNSKHNRHNPLELTRKVVSFSVLKTSVTRTVLCLNPALPPNISLQCTSQSGAVTTSGNESGKGQRAFDQQVGSFLTKSANCLAPTCFRL
jgi:hypothetical protein